MWYVLDPTGVAFAGIGNDTVKRGTWANEGAATPRVVRSRTPGNASIPPAPTAPLIRNSCLDIRLLVISSTSSGLPGPKQKPATAYAVAGCTTSSTRPLLCPLLRGKFLGLYLAPNVSSETPYQRRRDQYMGQVTHFESFITNVLWRTKCPKSQTSVPFTVNLYQYEGSA